MSERDDMLARAREQRERAAQARARAHENRHDKALYDYYRDQAAQADTAAAAYEAAAKRMKR